MKTKLRTRCHGRGDVRTFPECELHVTTDKVFMHCLLVKLTFFFFLRCMARIQFYL